MGGFWVSNTMKVLHTEDKKIDYIVLKIGDKVYSSNYGDITKGFLTGQMQVVDTKGIGTQPHLWIKNKFTEEKGHKKLAKELPFELNVYFHDDEEKKEEQNEIKNIIKKEVEGF